MQISNDRVGPAAAIASDGPGGLQLKNLIVVSGGPLIVTFKQIRLSAVCKCAGVFGVKLDGGVEVLERAIVFSLFLIGDTTVIQSFGIIGVDLERLVEILDGAVEIGLLDIGVAPVVIGDCDALRLYSR